MKNLFLFTFLLLNFVAFSQKTRVFNGELLYEIERVSPKDSIPGKMLIYAKDSLLRVVNFSSSIGKQEVIKHLRLNRSYVLVTTTKGDFADLVHKRCALFLAGDWEPLFREHLSFREAAFKPKTQPTCEDPKDALANRAQYILDRRHCV
jgi:hypothetical protein